MKIKVLPETLTLDSYEIELSFLKRKKFPITVTNDGVNVPATGTLDSADVTELIEGLRLAQDLLLGIIEIQLPQL